MDAREDDRPRKLANVERAQRYDEQSVRLKDLDLVGEHEVSHGLVDLVGQLVEDNVLRYARWGQATKRDAELPGSRVDACWKPDADGIVKRSGSILISSLTPALTCCCETP